MVIVGYCFCNKFIAWRTIKSSISSLFRIFSQYWFVKFKLGIHWFCVFHFSVKDGENLLNFLGFSFSSSLQSLCLNCLSFFSKNVNLSPSQTFLTLSLCIAISSSSSITFSLKCVMQRLIFSVIVFWSNWHKLSLISLVAKATLKCSDLISKFLGYTFFSKHFVK